MEDERTLLIGVDLADDFTQLSCYNGAGELYSVSLSKDPMKYRIPTVLCACYDTREWLFGEGALAVPESENTMHVTGLVSLAEQNGSVEIAGKSYTADMLLERYFRRLLAALRTKVGDDLIKGMVVTVRECNEHLKNNLYSALELLGIRQDRLRVITHLESFMYYVVSQNRDIWINDVGLFDFDANGFVHYRLSFGRKQQPMPIVADKQDCSDIIKYEMLEKEPDRLLYAFENTASLMLHKQIISSLYFTGNGFESTWADDILKSLCGGRRIFRGQNLYVKGAGYASKLFFEGGAGEYLLISDDVLKSSISMRVFRDGGYEELSLGHIGQDYRTVTADIDVIMDDTNELDLIVRNTLKKDFICAIMTLETMRIRSDRSVRLNIRLKFTDRDTCVITARDVGFGEIYATDNRIWEQVLKV